MSQSNAPKASTPAFWRFSILWFGQFISVIGSSLTTFALGIWVYQQTSSATFFAFITLAGTLPGILIAPIAGTLSDRWNRRLVLIGSDLIAGLGIVLLAILFAFHLLAIWAICAVVAIGSLCMSFRLPTYFASISLLVPKQHLGRANGMVQAAEASAQIIAPVLAGTLLVFMPLSNIFLLDVASFCFAVITLIFIAIPQPQGQTEENEEKGNFFREAIYGWTYIYQRKGLLGLLLFFALINFAFGFSEVLLTPLLLSLTNSAILGTILSVGAAGLLLGSLFMGIWGGPKRRISAILGFGVLFGLGLTMTGLFPSIWLIGGAVFVTLFSVPVINSCSQAIWQTKTAAEVQGRVFAIRAMIAWSTVPIAQLLAGPLADKVFEPLFANGRQPGIGSIIGFGPGRGIAFLFIIMGLLPIITSLLWYLLPRIRNVEIDLPDAIQETAEPSGAL